MSDWVRRRWPAAVATTQEETMHETRQLFLLRHAKSSWSDPQLADFDRPLNDRGERAAQRIAVHLRETDVRPELVLCSPARRTRDTLAAIRSVLGPAEIEFDEQLYGAAAVTLLRRLRVVDDRIRSVLVIGHNPGLEDLALALAGGGEQGALAQLRTKFPTAALACLEITTPWAELAFDVASLRSLVLPRNLPD
jgi:phosphohistidine phosphatase